MLPILPGLLTVVGPLLNGAWDLWAQSFLLLAILGGGALWLCGWLRAGSVPLPPPWLLAWATGLAVWGGVSACAGPLPAYAVPAWHVRLAGLATILAVSVMPAGERRLLDRGIRAAAWLMALLAVYQHFALGQERPCASLLNQNAFAGAILLFVPLAAEQEDWLLCGVLLLCLAWTRSLGAWLGLAAALLIVRRRSLHWSAAAGAVVVLCLALLCAKLQDPAALNRWHWWSAAARMAWARPWLGFGPGTFAYVLPAYVDPGRPLGTQFAHQHFLETAAEQGWPYLLAWLSGILLMSRRCSAAKRVGVLALLAQSLWDYSLSLPAVLWLFCRFAGDGVPESRRSVMVPACWRLPACVLVLALCGVAGGSVWRPWEADRLRARALALVRSAGPSEQALELLRRSSSLADHPETARLSGQIEWALARQGRLWASAAELERAAAQNSYRASTWAMLETVYRRLGREDMARAARRRGAATCPSLGGP